MCIARTPAINLYPTKAMISGYHGSSAGATLNLISKPSAPSLQQNVSPLADSLPIHCPLCFQQVNLLDNDHQLPFKLQ